MPDDINIFDGAPDDASILAPAPAAPAPKKPVQLRRFGDVDATRAAIYDSVFRAAQEIQPLQNQRHTLALQGVYWGDNDQFTKAERKKAGLTGGTLGRRLRGTWVLSDNTSGAELGRKEATLMTVPHLTEGGTFIHRGNEYGIRNQQRMRSGVYTREKENSEIEAHANILTGGPAHRYFLDPEKGVFYIKFGQGHVPLLPLLTAMGATEPELRQAWGPELYATNYQKADASALTKLGAKLVPRRDISKSLEQQLREKFEGMTLDPEVTRRTMSQPFDRLHKDAMLDITRKLLAVSRGQAQVDDRDHLAYQTVLGPEDIFAERVRKDRAGVRRLLLYKMSGQGSLDKMPAGALQDYMDSALQESGLASALEEINSLEIHDKMTQLSRMGEGGIASIDSIPDESRSVQPSHLGFVDLIRTPESFRVGVDTFLAGNAQKGDDGKLYAKFLDPQGREVWKNPQEVADTAVAFPGALQSNAKRVPAMKDGKITWVTKDQVGLTLPPFEHAFSPLGNLVPLKSMVKPQRVAMASRMYTQALALVNPEAPLVQSAIPGTQGARSFEDEYGRQAGAMFADQGGTVVAAEPGALKVRYDNGSRATLELYNNHPYNRKSFLHQTPVLTPGQRFTPGQLLARSNFTDDGGATALGVNARVAYLPWAGKNFEDAVVISESMAKRLTSVHAYQHQLPVTEHTKLGKNAYVSLFPAKYDKDTLAKMDDNGLVKVGTTVNFEDPLILGAQQRATALNKIHKKNQAAYLDASVTWQHHDPGVVTDVVEGKEGPVVLVKSQHPMQVGDKMCYTADTQVLTNHGWCYFAQWRWGDCIASLTPDGHLEYVAPVAIQCYPHTGRMYEVQTTQIDLCVTDNHKLYAKKRSQNAAVGFSLWRADALMGKRYHLKTDAIWVGSTPRSLILPALTVTAGQHGHGTRELPPLPLACKTYMMLLGLFLSEGNLVENAASGNYGIDITQIKPESRRQILAALTAAGVAYSEQGRGTKIRIYGKQLLEHFRPYGEKGCSQKQIPAFVFAWSRELLQELYFWLMLGDGSQTGTGHSYHTTSPRLADDVQRLCLHIGYAGKVEVQTEAGPQTIRGQVYNCRTCYAVRIYRCKTEPTINHGHAKTQNGQREHWINYDGDVYCATLPRNHVMYVRRNGKACWCGNSGRFGDKGVVSAIIPDAQMPADKTGQPFELLANPLGVISRCYDEQTEFLTERGWVFGRDVQETDRFLCYHSWTDGLFVMDQLAPFYVADYQGPMLYCQNRMVDFCVTPNHRMWAAGGWAGSQWREVTAARIAKVKGWKVPVVAKQPVPGVDTPFVLPHLDYDKKDTASCRDEIVIAAVDWAAFLGWYVAEGNVDDKVHISQSSTANPEACRAIAQLLRRLPFAWWYNPKNTQFHITSKRLCSYIKSLRLGLCRDKFIPAWVFDQSPETRQKFLDTYLQGDGSKDKSARAKDYSGAGTMSPKLAADLQRLLLYQGVASNTALQGCGMWRVSICLKRHRVLEPKHWHKLSYKGKIYCPTVPTGYVVTRRNGKALIAGNTNPAQWAEAKLGAIARKTGRPFKVEDFDANVPDRVAWVEDLMKQHGIPDTEDVTDPATGNKIPGVYTGTRFFMKLVHTAEGKSQGRGGGAYTADDVPAKGGETGAKRVAMLDMNALASHGATEVMRDARAIRGQGKQQEEYWLQFLQGYTPRQPSVPLVYQKFVNELKAAGINVVKDGAQLNIMALTDKDIDKLAEGRNLQNSDTVSFDEELRPATGGLFDPALTGSHHGNRWSAIQLTEPMPNPVMEEPVRRVLGLTQKKSRTSCAWNSPPA